MTYFSGSIMPEAMRSMVSSNSFRVQETLPMSWISWSTARFMAKGISGSMELPIMTTVPPGRTPSRQVARASPDPTTSKARSKPPWVAAFMWASRWGSLPSK